MAQAVQHAIETGEHLAVQAGTGTGKSLAYLVPAVAHAMDTGSSVVVATATIALQRQLIDRDLPRLAAALEPVLGRAPTFAILKGRGNYLCRYRLNGGAPEEPGETLFDPAAELAARRTARILTGEGLKAGDVLDQLREAAEGLGRVLPEISPGRMDILAEPLATALIALRAAATSCAAQVRAVGKEISDDAERLAQGRAALAALSDIAETSERVLGAFGDDVAARPDVVWMDRAGVDERQRPPTLHVAPLQVGGLLAERVFRRRTVVLTSATLAVGGSFEPLARQWGLPLGEGDGSRDGPGHERPATDDATGGAAGDDAARDDATGDGVAGSG